MFVAFYVRNQRAMIWMTPRSRLQGLLEARRVVSLLKLKVTQLVGPAALSTPVSELRGPILTALKLRGPILTALKVKRLKQQRSCYCCC